MEQNKINKNDLLSQTQKNSLAAILQLIEKNLYNVRLQLKAGEYNGVVYSVKIEISPCQLDKICNKIKQIEDEILFLKERYDLPVKERTLSKQLMSLSSYFWSVLIDKKTEKLKRYGAVPDQLKTELDPHIDSLISLVNGLSEIVTE